MSAPEFTPGQIAEADQWLANIGGHLEQPLGKVRAIIAAGGDRSVAFRRIAREVIHELERGGQTSQITFGFSYAALLLLINDHRKDEK